MARRSRSDEPEHKGAPEEAPDAEAEAATGRPTPGARNLTRDELETLRARLQKKFH